MAKQPEITAYFRNDTRQNKGASAKAGRPIFEDIEVCVLRIPGNTNSIVVHRADEKKWVEDAATGARVHLTYAEIYADQYARFKAGQNQVQSGTPLSELTFLTEAKRRELNALGIYTAEQLSALEGPPLKALGQGGRVLKDQSSAYLDRASSGAVVTQQASEIAGLKEQVAQLMELISGGASKPEVIDPETAADDRSEFDDWADDDLKDWITTQTGSRPRGNPNHTTLIRMAKEATAEKQAA